MSKRKNRYLQPVEEIEVPEYTPKIGSKPSFSFEYLHKVSYPKCKDVKFFHNFIERLGQLSELGWKEIGTSDRHSFGTEKISIKQLKPNLNDTAQNRLKGVTELTVFRATGNNLPFIGIREGDVFHILFVETQFGDLYDHD